MDRTVNINFHYGKQWVLNPSVQYVGGDVDVCPNVDPDYICYEDIKYRYKNGLGFLNVKNIFVLEPGKDLKSGLYLVNDDESIRRTLYYISKYTWVREIDIYAQCEIDEPLFAPIVLPLPGPEIERQTTESDNANVGEGELPTQCSRVDIGDGNTEHTTYVNPSGYVSEDTPDEDHECDNASDSDREDEQGNEGHNAPDMNKQRVSYDENDGLPNFFLGMTFGDAKEARDAISRYAVARGVRLKLNPNEKLRIRAKCKNDSNCPFVVFVSQDGRNPGLVVKTYKPEHTCYRNFKIPQASAEYLAKYFKEKIYRNRAYKIAGMKTDYELQLKLHVCLSKLKRAKNIVLREMDGSFKVEFGYLEAYAAALKRSNPGTKAEIELCKNALQEGRRVFRRMFICFDACKKGWRAGCRPLIGLDGCFLKGICKG